MGWLVGSLAPATACFLFSISVVKHGNGGIALSHEPMIAMILSNQNYAAYASGNFKSAQNNLSGVTFEWTNHNVSPSSMGPF